MIKRFFSNLATNYAPLDVNIVRGRDINLWDVNGKRYVDMLAAYSTVNQGHCHPRIVDAVIKQLGDVSVVSRSVRNSVLENWAGKMAKTFSYSRVLPMNSGTEAVEAAIKLSRKYGRERMSIGNPHIVALTGNYHGKSLATLSLSDYDFYRQGFGPYMDNVVKVQINNKDSLFAAFDHYGSQISAILYEPIQGEGGVVPMTHNFMSAIQSLRRDYPGLLLIADEIQSGLGRSGGWTAGKILFSTMDDYHTPDVLLLGKSLTGGMTPMSVVMANSSVMDVFQPGSHGSTYGGNPLAAAASNVALDVLELECMTKANLSSVDFKKNLVNLSNKYSQIVDVRGVGLFIGIQFHPDYDVERLRHRLLDTGYITMTARGNVLRITPPLTISSYELERFVDILGSLLEN